MNGLQAEPRRLYLVTNADLTRNEEALIDSQSRVRAMVIELTQQAGWEAVVALCNGIQGALDLPTPAIAVSGGAGFQVWLSLAEPAPMVEAQTFLVALCQRFLSQVPARHVQCQPMASPAAYSRLVPALQGETGRWSAFVAPGLASMFVDEPWLDVPPGGDAQAQLLSRLESISPVELARAARELGISASCAAHPLTPEGLNLGVGGTEETPLHIASESDPRRFLLTVMNDPAVPMVLRIEAAKALLPSS